MQDNITKVMTDQLMLWFEDHRREMPWRGSKDPYHIWVSEMMLQQTQVATVESYYHNWIKQFPDVETLAKATLESVLKVWEGLGYYTRARNFHKGANYIVEHYTDKSEPFPKTYQEWLKVPGVGPYTAAAVSSIAFAYPAAVVDANVKRVMSRLFCIHDNIASQKYHRDVFNLMNMAFFDHHPGWVNQAWMELGSLQCTPTPDCSLCPLQNQCCAYKTHSITDFPVKIEKKKVPTRYGAAFIIENQNKTLLLKRPEDGFLGGLWEYPSFTLKENDPDYLDMFCKDHHLQIKKKLPKQARHSYSHFHQELKLFIADMEGPWETEHWIDARFVDKEEQKKLPQSKITHKINALIKEL
jgi:A/G-specific adenine glycosylase